MFTKEFYGFHRTKYIHSIQRRKRMGLWGPTNKACGTNMLVDSAPMVSNTLN